MRYEKGQKHCFEGLNMEFIELSETIYCLQKTIIAKKGREMRETTHSGGSEK